VSDDVWILGISMTKFGKHPDKDTVDLAAEAARGALADGGVSMREMEVLAAGNLMGGGGMGQQLQKQIGQTGIPVYNVANACATGATALRVAYMAVKAGEADLGIAVGVEKLAGAGLLGSGGARKSDKDTWTPSGRYGAVTPVDSKRMTLDEIMNDVMIAYPNTRPMCSANCDGAAAAVVVSDSKLKTLSKEQQRRAVKISASVLTTDPWEEACQILPNVNTLTRNAATTAYEKAGVGPDDLDLVELHDCFATAELVHYDNLKLCEPGGAVDFFQSGATWRDGKTPVNVSGGLESKGHPIAATGIANIWEVCQHLRGEGGDRQIEGAKVGLAHVIGLGSACGVHILEKSAA
jgi:acetyl-CoA acyltransferase